MSLEQRKIKSLFTQLVNTPARKFPLSRQKLEAPDLKGVYIIYNSRGRVLHVGRTPRAKRGLAQRLRDHMRGNSSFAAAFFGGDGAQLRGTHHFRCMPVKNDRYRVLLEAYAIGVLCPKHIGHGLLKEALS